MITPRLLCLLLILALPLLSGCETTRTTRPVPYSGLDLRTTERLQERRRTLQTIEDSYLARGGPPDKMTNRRQLARLSDEIALQKLEEKRAIELELARRHALGDPRAHFPGIETLDPPPIPSR
ncbi:MAG: hypothetical protein SNJ84_06545 [Verrucomicrobiia bacterium]